MSFNMLIQSVETLDFDVVVFDTAPTGHTLRFLNFPAILEKGMDQLLGIRNKFGAVFASVQSMFGSEAEFGGMVEKIFGGIDRMKTVAQKVNARMCNPDETNFVAVCIPEFLSMYETERLVLQLAKLKIEINSVVINQVLYPEGVCKMCHSRTDMQQKYISQIKDLFEDFHIVLMPLQDREVRGVPLLSDFAPLLLRAKPLPRQ